MKQIFILMLARPNMGHRMALVLLFALGLTSLPSRYSLAQRHALWHPSLLTKRVASNAPLRATPSKTSCSLTPDPPATC